MLAGNLRAPGLRIAFAFPALTATGGPSPALAIAMTVAVTVAMTTGGCGKPSFGTRNNDGGQQPLATCSSDDDCAAPTPLCIDAQCVACTSDADCGCHAVCTDHRCEALGADSANRRYSAHGTWRGQPGTEAYAFVGYCQGDADCAAGQRCNPLTSGCLPAADFEQPCGMSERCPAGPGGEVLACVPSLNLCLPAARCLGQANCCGGSEALQCDAGAGLCVVPQTQCTPPAADTITSTCPMQPRVTGTCAGSLFCSSTGTCIQCGCDADCDPASGLTRCYGATGRCVRDDYCGSAAECGAGKTCDLRQHVCKTACDGDADCSADFYCDTTDRVCRSLTDRACEPDSYEPNDTLAAAQAAAAANPAWLLTVPAQNTSSSLRGLSLCGSDVDFFAMQLTAGSRIIMSADTEELFADTAAYGPDGVTALAFGSLSSWGGEDLDFTAQVDGLHYIEVAPWWDDDAGFYSWTIQHLAGEICRDALESPEARSSNNSITTATALLGGDAPPPPPECQLTASASRTTLSCGSDIMKLCAGDVDFYRIDIAAGADLTVNLSGFSRNLDLEIYGPFTGDETPSTSSLAGSSNSTYWDEEVVVTARTASFFVVRVYNAAGGGETSYALDIEITPPQTACIEDAFDAPTAAASGSTTPALVADAAGLNDRMASASWLALDIEASVDVSGPAQSALGLCRGDVDWFRLGVPGDGGSIVDVPAGLRVDIEVGLAAAPPGTGLSVGAGHDAEHLFGVSAAAGGSPAHVLVRPTDGGPYYVAVIASDNNTKPMPYTLRIALAGPAACAGDALGDHDGANNNAPALATPLTAPPWPTARGEAYAAGPNAGLALCASDLDWYKLAVPSGAAVVATVLGDPAASDVALALYGASVIGAATPAGELIPATGLIAKSTPRDWPYQWVHGDASGETYLVIYNTSGWPLLDYQLRVGFIDGGGCVEDPSEPNNTWQTATPLALAPVGFEPGLVAGLAPLGTFCDDVNPDDRYDWFRIPIEAGDTLFARAYYDPSEGDLDVDLYPPPTGGTLGSYVASDRDDLFSPGGQDGILEISATADADGDGGAYYLKVTSYDPYTGGNQNRYHVEVFVRRACVDDRFESSTPHALAWQPAQTLADLRLCGDDDWFVVDVPAPASGQSERKVTICAAFVHDSGDIDLEVFGAPGGAPADRVALAATKTNTERVTFSVTTAASRYVHVFVDDDEPAPTTYALSVLDGDLPCP